MSWKDKRLRDPISRSEQERRWAAVRAIMDETDIDAIVVQGAVNSLGIGGYFRWLTGSVALGSYATTAIFPRRGELTIIAHGPFGGDFPLDPANEEYPGAVRRLTSPSFPMIQYTATLDADLAAVDLRKRGCRRVALLGSFGMGYDFVHHLLGQLGDAVTLVPVTDAVDRVKAVKSAEEIALIRKAAAMQDELMALAPQIIRPGLREFEISAQLGLRASLAGCETGFLLGGSGKPGEPGPPMFPRHVNLQGRTLQEGDTLLVLAENSGPGGMVTHISRLFVLGKADPEIAERYQAVLDAQDYTLSMLTPGAPCAEVFAKYNDYMVARGFSKEQRLHAHGQGYDIVERPLIRMDETMDIEADMNIGIHPMIMYKGVLVFSTDNYLIGEAGSERLHKTERKIFEIAC